MTGVQKNKNEQISVSHFCEKHAIMGAKKTEMFKLFFVGRCVFFVATYGNEVISVGGHKKNTDLRNCSRLSRQCTRRPASEDDVCPRWASFSNFKPEDYRDLWPVFHGPPSHFCIFVTSTAHSGAHTKNKI